MRCESRSYHNTQEIRCEKSKNHHGQHVYWVSAYLFWTEHDPEPSLSPLELH